MIHSLLWQSYIAAKRFQPIWDQIDAHRAMSPDKARLDLVRRLQKQIRHFAAQPHALPEWKHAANIQNPESFMRFWQQIPILTRRDLQTTFHPSRLTARGSISRTGGSTGEPTPFLHDGAMLHATTAARLYCRMQAGWQPGMHCLAVWGSDRDVGIQNSWRNRISSSLRRESIVGGYQLNQHTVDRVVDFVCRHRPVALYGFTSMLEYVSKSILDRGMSIPDGAISAAWNGGEMLYPRQAELFELAFGKPLLNLYGSRELSAMAFQPFGDAPLIVLRPLLYLEIIDDEGKPAAPYQSGRLIWTSTVCQGTPFLRYECGDLGSYAFDGIDASGIHRISELHGRTAGLIELGGKTVNNLFWNHLFKDYPEVQRFQVVVERSSALRFRLEGSGLSEDREQHLKGLIQNIAGDCLIKLEWVAAITRNGQGKLEQVVREA